MRRLQAQLDDVPVFDDDLARNGQKLVDNPVDARIGEGRVAEYPASGPGQQGVGQVRASHQGLLGGQPPLASPV